MTSESTQPTVSGSQRLQANSPILDMTTIYSSFQRERKLNYTAEIRQFQFHFDIPPYCYNISRVSGLKHIPSDKAPTPTKQFGNSGGPTMNMQQMNVGNQNMFYILKVTRLTYIEMFWLCHSIELPLKERVILVYTLRKVLQHFTNYTGIPNCLF